MIITCQSCECRFRVDDTKLPSGTLTVSCPKCQTTTSASNIVDVRESAMAMGKSPSTSNPRFHRSPPAPLFRMGPNEASKSEEVHAPSNSANELALSLLSLLKPQSNDRTAVIRPTWDKR